jgi:hypothetical protein
MDLEATEARNDCAGEGQQSYNRPTDICPFDSNICTEDDFAAGDTRDRPQISNYDPPCPSDLTTELHGNMENTPHSNGSSDELSPSQQNRCSSGEAQQ